ncbi:extensin-like [Humulus lupulus]|uniref:extensin-like n=1 Tax=Humulus lupulus TaxID=3486 RepID=UPI002B400CAD|nr:extensin-like [Humulus lupulus]
MPLEQAQVIGNFSRPTPNTYSNSYTPAWKNHPNLSWKHNQGLQPQYSQYTPQQLPNQPTYGLHSRPYYDPNPRPSHPPPHPPMNTPTTQPEQGNLPSSIEENPKEQCNAISLRSGTKHDGPTVDDKGKKTKDQHVTSPSQEEVTEDLPKKKKPKYTEPTPRIPKG